MTTYPRPGNLKLVRKLDTYLHELLKEKKKTTELTFDAAMEKISNKTIDFMGSSF